MEKKELKIALSPFPNFADAPESLVACGVLQLENEKLLINYFFR